MNYGRAIKIARTAYGLTQTELAKRVGLGTSQISLIESGKREPSLRVLHAIASALDVPVHLLTLLAARPEDLKDKVDPKQVADLGGALLQLLARLGDQGTLPLAKSEKPKKKRVPRKRKSA